MLFSAPMQVFAKPVMFQSAGFRFAGLSDPLAALCNPEIHERSSPMDRSVSLIDAGQESQCVIKTHLANARGFVLRRIYSSAEEALHDILGHPPDLVLINVRLPGMCGFECARTLKKLMPKLVVVMFTDQPELTSFIRAYQAGGDGYFVFPCAAESFHETLINAMGGWKPFSKEIQKLLIERLVQTSALADTKAALTPAELRIMAYLSMGLSERRSLCLRGLPRQRFIRSRVASTRSSERTAAEKRWA